MDTHGRHDHPRSWAVGWVLETDVSIRNNQLHDASMIMLVATLDQTSVVFAYDSCSCQTLLLLRAENASDLHADGHVLASAFLYHHPSWPFVYEYCSAIRVGISCCDTVGPHYTTLLHTSLRYACTCARRGCIAQSCEVEGPRLTESNDAYNTKHA